MFYLYKKKISNCMYMKCIMCTKNNPCLSILTQSLLLPVTEQIIFNLNNKYCTKYFEKHMDKNDCCYSPK